MRQTDRRTNGRTDWQTETQTESVSHMVFVGTKEAGVCVCGYKLILYFLFCVCSNLNKRNSSSRLRICSLFSVHLPLVLLLLFNFLSPQQRGDRCEGEGGREREGGRRVGGAGRETGGRGRERERERKRGLGESREM